MHACTVTASKGKSAISVVVVGHCAAKLPALVEKEAAAIAKGGSATGRIVTDNGTFILVKPKSDAWLIGGEGWRILGKDIAAAVRAASEASAEVLVEGAQADVSALVEGTILGDYRYVQLRSGDAAKRQKITLRLPGHSKAVKDGIISAESQNLVRTLGDGPGNVVHPKSFVSQARAMLKGLPVTIKVISGVAELKKAGFPGLVQVGQAGDVPPALLEIRYSPKKVAKKAPKLALVGKGITFDSGGLSLKPGAGMWEMKGDMGGAAAVLGAMRIIASRKGKNPVTGYIALAENLPDTHAQRPGDIYKARNGKYIHVDNTDAEGRLVLSDVLTYACEQGATHCCDAATLTGACLVALGTGIAGLMSNDDEWAQTVRQAGLGVGEECWQLPLYGEYRALLDHPHADLNNIGGRFAGTMTAGLFLQEFVDAKVKWAHLDIAGPAMRGGSNWRYYTRGNTGFGVRTMAALADSI